MAYMRYPAGNTFISLLATSSEPIAQGTNATLRVRNQTGQIMTITGFEAFCTLAGNAGTADLQDVATATHLAAALNLGAGATVASTTITGLAGTTKANGADFYVVLTNPGGAANFITNGQAQITCSVPMAST